MIRKPFHKHLKNGDDLVTTYEEVRAGFVALALERNRRATPIVAQARALKSAAQVAKIPQDLLNISKIRLTLITAAGISDKASGHMEDQDKLDAIKNLISNFLEPAGPAFIEELVFRFLLTRGDTLGGSMRNIGGALAQRKLTRAILARLILEKVHFVWLHGPSNEWLNPTIELVDIESDLRGFGWSKDGHNRTLIYNLVVRFIGNNIDICLYNTDYRAFTTETIKTPESYIALGELKGGIDPAGADEHWKTARTAFTRINNAFSKCKLYPHTFFIGAAIEKRMAEEIWMQLKKGTLSNAANLTDEDQIASLCDWLCSL